MKKNMKTSEVFKEAARLLDLDFELFTESRRTCCDAIGAAQGLHYTVETKAKRLFIELFKPEKAFECDCWMGTTYSNEEREHRIWAMLFMAEITKRMR